MTQILAISGSLRARSINTAILRAAKTLAPKNTEITLYEGLGAFPLFNPDDEEKELAPIIDFRNKIKASDGVIIASPEYAHGVTGVIKNALDWIVGSGELVGKPVALFNASSRSLYAPAALRETLMVMDTRIVDAACVTIPFIGREVDASDFVSNKETSRVLFDAVAALVKGIEDRRKQAGP